VVARDDDASGGRSAPFDSGRLAGTGRSRGAGGSDGACRPRWGITTGGGILSLPLEDSPGASRPFGGTMVCSV
jgi:hypothetical protein